MTTFAYKLLNPSLGGRQNYDSSPRYHEKLRDTTRNSEKTNGKAGSRELMELVGKVEVSGITELSPIPQPPGLPASYYLQGVGCRRNISSEMF